MTTPMGILKDKDSAAMQKEMELTEAILPQLSHPVLQMVQMMMEKMGKEMM